MDPQLSRSECWFLDHLLTCARVAGTKSAKFQPFTLLQNFSRATARIHLCPGQRHLLLRQQNESGQHLHRRWTVAKVITYHQILWDWLCETGSGGGGVDCEGLWMSWCVVATVLHFVATFPQLPILEIFLSHCFFLQRVTTKQAVAPAPTDQTQPLVGEFQVWSMCILWRNLMLNLFVTGYIKPVAIAVHFWCLKTG